MDKKNKENSNKTDIRLTVKSDDVALPEVRTNKVSPEGNFHKEQNEKAREGGILFDTVAIPEYHTGKCPDWDPDCND